MIIRTLFEEGRDRLLGGILFVLALLWLGIMIKILPFTKGNILVGYLPPFLLLTFLASSIKSQGPGFTGAITFLGTVKDAKVEHGFRFIPWPLGVKWVNTKTETHTLKVVEVTSQENFLLNVTGSVPFKVENLMTFLAHATDDWRHTVQDEIETTIQSNAAGMLYEEIRKKIKSWGKEVSDNLRTQILDQYGIRISVVSLQAILQSEEVQKDLESGTRETLQRTAQQTEANHIAEMAQRFIINGAEPKMAFALATQIAGKKPVEALNTQSFNVPTPLLEFVASLIKGGPK